MKYLKLMTLFILILFMLNTAYGLRIEIKTIEELISVGEDSKNQKYVLVKDLDFCNVADYENAFEGDITINNFCNNVSKQNGSIFINFSGELDGAGFSINNIFLDNLESLFTNSKNKRIIKNLSLNNLKLSNNPDTDFFLIDNKIDQILFGTDKFNKKKYLIEHYSNEKEIRIINPYETVDFEKFNIYKANLHTHTTESDGKVTPDVAIKHYSDANYSILSITDHNKVTWPWSNWLDENPSIINEINGMETSAFYPNLGKNGMLAIKGNEFSREHHRGSYFNNISGSKEFADIEYLGGVGVFFHPGRYSENVGWYNDYFDKHRNTIVGIEVYNKRDIYPKDRKLWDAVNKNREYNDLVWGFANDDTHKYPGNLYNSYSRFYMKNLTEEDLRNSLKFGSFTFSYEPNGNNPDLETFMQDNTPVLTNVVINNGFIIIEGDNYDIIEWYADNNNIVLRENIIDVNDFNSNFLRAVLINEHGRTYLQPFGYKYVDVGLKNITNKEFDEVYFNKIINNESTYNIYIKEVSIGHNNLMDWFRNWILSLIDKKTN